MVWQTPHNLQFRNRPKPLGATPRAQFLANHKCRQEQTSIADLALLLRAVTIRALQLVMGVAIAKRNVGGIYFDPWGSGKCSLLTLLPLTLAVAFVQRTSCSLPAFKREGSGRSKQGQGKWCDFVSYLGTLAHPPTHAHAHAHADARPRARARARAPTPTRPHAHTHTPTHVHTYTSAPGREGEGGASEADAGVAGGSGQGDPHLVSKLGCGQGTMACNHCHLNPSGFVCGGMSGYRRHETSSHRQKQSHADRQAATDLLSLRECWVIMREALYLASGAQVNKRSTDRLHTS